MICLASRLPILQVGAYQISNYNTDWLLRALRDGLEMAEIPNPEVAQDVYEGVLYYLENDCPWKPLPIEKLYQKVASLLEKVGLGSARDCLPMYSPEIRISVAAKLEKLECHMEIALLKTLAEEVQSLHQYGVERVVFEEIKEAVYSLIPTKRWTKECQILHDEIFSLQELGVDA